MAEGDELPIFRPRLGGGPKPSSRSGCASFRSAVLSRAGGRGGSAGRGPAARSRVAVRAPTPASRRVVVKAHLAKMKGGGAKAAALHIRYIERDGVEKDGSKGRLYGAEGRVSAAAFEEPRLGEAHQFRLIVSPEDAKDLDLTDYIRRYMARVELDLGRKLEWAAVNHYDTDHPHAHLVIRGVDRDGREVRLDRGYISNGLRFRAQELATEELGPRLDVDVRRAHVREIADERLTSLDRALAARAQGSRVDLASLQASRAPDGATLVARLEHLEAMRLATRTSRASWELAEGWQEQLRALGERGDILKQIHLALHGDPSRYRVLRDGDALAPDQDPTRSVVSGRVAQKGLSDELRGAYYAVVEAPDGCAFHVALDARAAEAVRPGDIVSIATRPEAAVRPVDRAIHAAATAHAGEYVEAPETPAAHRHRLRELAKIGLATPSGPDRWRIAADLLSALEARSRGAGLRHRLLVHREPLGLAAQVHHRGPVWLDRLEPAALAPHGFGAEVRRALERRQDALRQFGIDPHDPKRPIHLRELERLDAGSKLAALRREVFAAAAPSRFRGRVAAVDANIAAGYAVVSDGARFVLVRSTPALRAAEGKQVTLRRDPKGRLLATPVSDRDRDRDRDL